MKWERKDKRIWVAVDAVHFERRSRAVALRVAPEYPREQRGQYRVDMKTLSFEPWEAVDNGRTFRTAREAQRFAREWLRAASAQQTYHPQLEV